MLLFFVGTALICCPVGCGRRASAEPVVTGGTAAAAAPSATVARASAPEEGKLMGSSLIRAPRERLCVTRGEIEGLPSGRLSVTQPKMRAVIAASTGQEAEVRFTYLGPVAAAEPLQSGEMRRQIGLKLRAQDGCNVVYVMWRIAPESKLVVSVKRNPGKRTSRECGNAGYTNIKALRSAPVPVLSEGASHALRAALTGDELRVFVDDRLVWQGALGPEALSFDGPAGVRTDNGRFEIELFAAAAAAGSAVKLAGGACGALVEEAE